MPDAWQVIAGPGKAASGCSVGYQNHAQLPTCMPAMVYVAGDNILEARAGWNDLVTQAKLVGCILCTCVFRS